MDGLTNLFSNVGTWLGSTGGGTGAPNWEKALTGGLFGAGELGNLLTAQKQNAYNNYILSIIKDPARLSAMINAATKPLSANLVQAVTNQVQGNMATRGLSQAPGIFATAESQALAPYQLAEQQQAQNAVLSALGLKPEFPQPANTAGALSTFLKTIGTRPSAIPDMPGIDWTPSPYLPSFTTSSLAPSTPNYFGSTNAFAVPTTGSES